MNISQLPIELITLQPETNPCVTTSGIKPECIYQQICSNLNDYIIYTGITVLILYVITSWVCWLVFSKDIFKIDYDKRIFWNNFVRDKMSKILAGYITVVIALNLI
jgi:hypothetical protein